MRRACFALLLLVLVATSATAQQPAEPTIEPSIEVDGDDGLGELRRETRSARLAVAMSFPVPGWGQLYADAPFWAVVSYGVQAYYLGSILLERQRAKRQDIQIDRLRAMRDGSADEDEVARLNFDIERRMTLADESKERARDFAWFAGGAWFLISLDAFVSVELADFDSGDPPTPDLDKDWDLPAPAGGDSSRGLKLSLSFDF